MIDEKRLAEIEERAAKATPGPWKAGRMDMRSYDAVTGELIKFIYRPNDDAQTRIGVHGDNCEEDGLFIAHARTDVPVLCAALREAQAQAAAMGRALEDAHDALGELLSDNGKDWDDLTDWTGNPSWQGLKGRIDAVLKGAKP